MKSVRLFVLLLATVVVSTAAQAQSRRGDSEPADRAPAEAIFFLGVTDTERLWADFQKTKTYKQMTDPELEEIGGEMAFFGKLREKFRDQLGKLLDVAPDQLKNPFAGPLTLYVNAPPGASPEELRAVLIASVGDRDLMQKYVDSTVSKLKEHMREYETETVQGQTVHIFRSPTEDADEEEYEEEDFSEPPTPERIVAEMIEDLFDPDNLPDNLVICFAGDSLYMASTLDELRQAMSGDRREPLSKTDDYRLLLRELRPIGELRVLVNFPRVFEMARAASADSEEATEVKQWLETIGAGSLRSLVGHLRFGQPSYDYKFDALCVMTGERTGLAGLLSRENREIAPPDWVAAHNAFYLSLNLNPGQFMEDIIRMVRQNSPEMADQMRQQLENVPLSPDGQPVNLFSEFLNHLTGPLTLAAGFTRPYDAQSTRLLLALQQRDRDAVTRFISKLPFLGEPRDIQGTQVYPDAMMSMAGVAVTRDRLLAGLMPAVESAVTGGESDPLARDEQFRRAERLVPREAWFIFFIDEHKMTEAVIELAKKPEVMGANPILGWLLSSMMGSGVDFTDTKLTDKMLGYCSGSIMTITTTTEGVHVTLVELKPRER